jgi:hypothetical protein
MTTTPLPLASDCAAGSAWSRQTITVKNDASCSRRPLTATRNRARAIPCLGGADLRVLGQVAGEADGCLSRGPALLNCLAGRSAVPLDPGDGGHRGMPGDRRRQATEPTKSAMDQDRRHAGSGAGLVGGVLAAGVGHASPVRPDPSTLGVAGERDSHHEGRSRPVPGHSRCDFARSRCPVALCARVLSGSPRTRRALHGSSGARQKR